MIWLRVLHVLSAAAYVGVAIYVMRRAPRLQRSFGVAGVAGCFAWWSASLMIPHQLGISEVEAQSGYNLGAVAWASFGSFALAFALAFANRSDLLASTGVRAALVVPPVIVTIAQWHGDLATAYPVETWGRGFQWSNSPLVFFFYAYYGVYVAAAIAVVHVAGRRATAPSVKRQAALITYTALVPMTCATATDVLLPRLGITSIPNIAPAFLLVWMIGVAVAIVRYRLLELTPETAAEDILSAMSDAVLLVDVEGKVVASNAEAKRLLADGLTLADLPRDSDEAEVNFAGRILRVSWSPVRDAGSVCLVSDITERTRTARANEELRLAVRTLGGLQTTVDEIHRGTTPAEIRDGVALTLPRALDPLLGCRVELDGESRSSVEFGDAHARFPIEVSGVARGAIEVHASRELSADERRTIERVAAEIAQALGGLALRGAIAQSDRLASIGVLAAGVAHEINNPLTYLLLGLVEVRDKLSTRDTDDPLLVRVGEAIHASDRIAKIVRELGSFARDGDELRSVAVAEAIDAAVAMAAHQLKHRARVIVSHEARGLVIADLGRLTQVFLNLLVNAAHAIQDGSADTNRVEITSRDDKSKGEVVVIVRDTGRGIPSEELPHVFEPFFPTKASGPSLGLAICHKIVRSMGGSIEATSTVGSGTRFELRLPRAEDGPITARIEASVTRSTPPPPPTGLKPSRILVVDDDVPVARALSRFLRGHDVVVASSGVEAQAKLGDGPGFDLVITDIMMPDINGPALYDWIRSNVPALSAKVVFMTGGAFTPETERFVDDHHLLVLAKPFELGEVKRMLEKYLTA